NGFDPAEYFDFTADAGVQPGGQQRPLVLSHVGAIYSNRSPRILLSSCVRLIENLRLDPNEIRILLTGPVEDRADALGGEPCDVLRSRGCLGVQGWVSRSVARSQMLTSDYSVVLDLIHLSGHCLAVPAKLYECIRIGKPILAVTARDSPMDRILANSGVS